MRTGHAWKTMTALLALTGLVALAAPAQAGGDGGGSLVPRAGGFPVGGRPARCRGIDHPTAHGYADQLYQALKVTKPKLQLKKLGCAVTETSENMLRGPSDCRTQYHLRIQLADAVEFLLKNRGSVALVTIDIGANDIETCGSLAGIDPACVQDAFSDVAANLPRSSPPSGSLRGPTSRSSA